MNISNTIAKLIMDMLEADGCAEMQRNELAQTVGCVPSQINYVIASRFTPEQGYIVESRRGGGGYIRITRATHSTPGALVMHVINHIGAEIDEKTARAHIINLCQRVNLQLQFIKFLVILPFNLEPSLHLERGTTTIPNYAWAAKTHSRRCLE